MPTANVRGPVATYVYNGDAGEKWLMRLTDSVAAAGGFGAAYNGTDAVKGYFPFHGKSHPRHIYIKTTINGKVFHDRIPIASLTNDQYKLTNLALSFDGRNYTVTSRAGELIQVT